MLLHTYFVTTKVYTYLVQYNVIYIMIGPNGALEDLIRSKTYR